MSTLTEISEAMQKGRAKLIKTLVPQALEEGIPAQEILQDGLLARMGRGRPSFQGQRDLCPRSSGGGTCHECGRGAAQALPVRGRC